MNEEQQKQLLDKIDNLGFKRGSQEAFLVIFKYMVDRKQRTITYEEVKTLFNKFK